MYLESGRPPKKPSRSPSISRGATTGGRTGRSSSGGGGGRSGGGGYSSPAPSYTPTYSGPPSTNNRGNYSGGGAPTAPPSGNNAGPVQRVAAPRKPEPPSVKKFVAGDADYQASRSQLIKNFQSLRTENRKNRGNIKEDYGVTKSRIGEERAKGLEDMQNDFAARGLLGSGVYGEKLTEFEKNYQNQQTDASTSQRRNLSQLLTDLKDAKRLRNQSLKQAKLEAIRRRAEKYGLR